MNAVVTAVLALLGAIAPTLGTSSISSVINALIEIIPLVTKEFTDVLPEIKNIIAALKANDQTNAEQLAQLATLDAQVDAQFDAAAAAAEAEDSTSV